MSVSAVAYTDPVTAPAGDIADNAYWKRDVRRNYSRTAVFKQSDISGLLTLGSVVSPKIGKGEEGAKQLVAARSQEGTLAQVLEQQADARKEVLQANGLPPLPGKALTWTQDIEGSYSSEYPCRSFV